MYPIKQCTCVGSPGAPPAGGRKDIDPNAAAGLRLNEVKGNVDLDAAEFSYPTRKTAKVLRRLNLAIKQGEKIALVGQSGECKKFCDFIVISWLGYIAG